MAIFVVYRLEVWWSEGDARAIEIRVCTHRAANSAKLQRPRLPPLLYSINIRSRVLVVHAVPIATSNSSDTAICTATPTKAH